MAGVSFAETEIVEDLGVDHPKLEAFQKAVEAILKKRLQEADEELQFVQKEHADKKKAKAQQTLQLHETQRLLKLEQRKLAKLTDETQVITHQRIYFENANRKYEAKLKDLTEVHKKERLRNDQLKEKYNRILASQIILTTRRINMAGAVNATQTEASKAEEDFRKLQEQKKLQDLYLNKLAKDMEDLEQRSLDYQSQVGCTTDLPIMMYLYNKSLRQVSMTSLYDKSLRQVSTTSLYDKSLQQVSTTSLYNKSQQQVSTTSLNKSL